MRDGAEVWEGRRAGAARWRGELDRAVAALLSLPMCPRSRCPSQEGSSACAEGAADERAGHNGGSCNGVGMGAPMKLSDETGGPRQSSVPPEMKRKDDTRLGNERAGSTTFSVKQLRHEEELCSDKDEQ